MGGDDDEVRKGAAGTFSRRKPLRETPLARCEEEKPQEAANTCLECVRKSVKRFSGEDE